MLDIARLKEGVASGLVSVSPRPQMLGKEGAAKRLKLSNPTTATTWSSQGRIDHILHGESPTQAAASATAALGTSLRRTTGVVPRQPPSLPIYATLPPFPKKPSPRQHSNFQELEVESGPELELELGEIDIERELAKFAQPNEQHLPSAAHQSTRPVAASGRNEWDLIGRRWCLLFCLVLCLYLY